ncbi:hypothetical protein RND81_05G223900 [Saponaria officinalis]|uniref:Retrovirus-related Pol polyprotein from transposon TNT 1-94-like beta-barrel domain-containing protein n=1 Tax=Saponaria officinalis TaxID=3572 RepID=A0AAW1L331_SAPOF
MCCVTHTQLQVSDTAVLAYEKAAEILLRSDEEIDRPELLSLLQMHHASFSVYVIRRMHQNNVSSANLEAALRCFQDLILKDQGHPSALINYAAIILCKYGSAVAVKEAQLTCTQTKEWKREMEICIASKRKMPLLTGRVTRSTTDPVKAAAWDACNNLIISWLLGSMDPLIRKSVMYYTNCKTIWDDLEARFTKSNGAQKFRLNKATYETSQNKRAVAEYYTELKMLWDELEALNEYPVITSFPQELQAYEKAVAKQNEERRLFQFLNGLDQEYSILRSNMLMMNPLPTVEAACAYIQQEEDMNKIGGQAAMEIEGSAFHTKGEHNYACSICKMDNHSEENCWKKVGYPPGHPKNIFNSGNKGFQNRSKRSSNAAYSHCDEGDITAALHKATKHLENLLRTVPGSSSQGQDIDEEIDQTFAGMIACNLVNMPRSSWIVDSGASDHMVTTIEGLKHVTNLKNKPRITLPNGETTSVTHVGTMKLENGLILPRVLVVPEFHQNLLSVQRLTSDNNCAVTFLKDSCLVQDLKTKDIKKLGKTSNGLYYLDLKKVEMEYKTSSKLSFANNLCSKSVSSDEWCHDTMNKTCNLTTDLSCNEVYSLNAKSPNYSI